MGGGTPVVHARRSTVVMTSTFVLRLLAADATTGRLVGRVSSVASGNERTIRDVADLVAFIEAELAGRPGPAAAPDPEA